MHWLREVGIGLIVPLALFALWVVSADRGWLPPQVLPAPSDLAQGLGDMWRSGDLVHHASVSLLRVVYGFSAGAIAGLALGIAMGLSRRVEDYVKPLFTAFAQVPTLGWIPFLMLLVGIGEGLKILVIAKAAFVPMVMNTSSGIRNIPPGYFEVAAAFRFTKLQLLRHLVLPAAVAPIFTGVRYGLTHAWLALVAVELLASSEGLGYLLVWGRQMFWLDTVMIAMIAIGVVGFILDKATAGIERRLQRWRVTALDGQV
ncbi:MAG: ABC transporter permease [Alphaproteobacteria bacterium]|nr:ABC transporter permease [Alphaproteobacteria bacterium]